MKTNLFASYKNGKKKKKKTKWQLSIMIKKGLVHCLWLTELELTVGFSP